MTDRQTDRPRGAIIEAPPELKNYNCQSEKNGNHFPITQWTYDMLILDPQISLTLHRVGQAQLNVNPSCVFCYAKSQYWEQER